MKSNHSRMLRRWISAVLVLSTSSVCLPAGRAAEKKPAKPAGYIRVEIMGTLKTGIVAIGGETTGTTITANGITWELEFGKETGLRKAAAKLNGKTVVVEGILTRRAGVEIKQRWIVTVSDLVGPEELAEIAAANMEALGKGVQLFYAQHRQPPKTLNALVKDPGGLRRWLPALDAETIPKDPWGNDFKYVVSKDRKTFTIISAGPDRGFDSKDDIKVDMRF